MTTNLICSECKRNSSTVDEITELCRKCRREENQEQYDPIMKDTFRGVRVSDLKDQTGQSNRPVLYCGECDSTYSANKGDYFMHPSSHVFECCGEKMRLVRRVVLFEEVEV